MGAFSAVTVSHRLQVRFWTALLIGAAVTPTDPIVSSAIVTGSRAKRVLPDHLRASLSLE